MRKDKLRRLSKLLPLVASMSGGMVHHASALELSAADLANRIAEAFQQNQLPFVRGALNQLVACNVRAIQIDGVEFPINDLQATIDRLASGQGAADFPRPTAAASFLIDPGDWQAEGVVCIPGQPTTAVVQTFPVGSHGPGTPAA